MIPDYFCSHVVAKIDGNACKNARANHMFSSTKLRNLRRKDNRIIVVSSALIVIN